MQKEWIPDKNSDIMLFFVMGMESGEVEMQFKHTCKQEVKKWSNLDLNQGPAGHESVSDPQTAASYNSRHQLR